MEASLIHGCYFTECMVMKTWSMVAGCLIAGMIVSPVCAQSVNGVPTLVSRTPSNSLLGTLTQWLDFTGLTGPSAPTPSTSSIAQGTNAFNLPSTNPIASPMQINRGSSKLTDFFFKPSTSTIITNNPTMGRSFFPTQSQLPGRAYLNQFGYTTYNR